MNLKDDREKETAVKRRMITQGKHFYQNGIKVPCPAKWQIPQLWLGLRGKVLESSTIKNELFLLQV